MYVHVQMHQFECLFLVIIFQSWLLIRGRFNFLKWSLNTEISADGRKIGVAQLSIIIYIPLPCNIVRWFGFFFISQAIFKAESDLDAWWRFKGSKKVEFNTATHLPPPSFSALHIAQSCVYVHCQKLYALDFSSVRGTNPTRPHENNRISQFSL